MGFGATHVKRRVQVDANQHRVIYSPAHAKNVLMVTMEMTVIKNAVRDVTPQ
jgi:hypothetical protein